MMHRKCGVPSNLKKSDHMSHVSQKMTLANLQKSTNYLDKADEITKSETVYVIQQFSPGVLSSVFSLFLRSSLIISNCAY